MFTLVPSLAARALCVLDFACLDEKIEQNISKYSSILKNIKIAMLGQIHVPSSIEITEEV